MSTQRRFVVTAVAAIAVGTALVMLALVYGRRPSSHPIRAAVYVDREYGFTVRAPAGWSMTTMKHGANPREIVLTPMPSPPDVPSAHAYAHLTVRKLSGDETADTLAKAYWHSLEQQADTFQVIDERPVWAGSHSGTSVSCTMTSNKAKSEWVRVVGYNGKGLACLWRMHVVPAEAARQYQAAFDEILAGFQWR
jgi:hypothetical protein